MQKLPPYFDILCTHPMFGPNSGSGTWKDLNFQFDKVRQLAALCRQCRAVSLVHSGL